MRIEDQLSSEQRQKLKALSKQNKPPSKKKKQERINWSEMMGMDRDTYKRHKGAIRRK